MKNTIFTIALAFVLVAAFAMPMILAEDNATSTISNTSVVTAVTSTDSTSVSTDTELQNEAAVDDNATVRFGQIGWNNLKLLLTFNQEKKAQIELELARLRLIQARIAANQNNTAAMQRALDAHQNILERLNQTMTQIESGSDLNGLNQSAFKFVELERAIQVHELRISRLSNLLNNSNLTEDQRSKIEDRLTHVENVTAHLHEVQQAKMDKIRTKMMAIGNLTEKEAQRMTRLNERQANVSERIANQQERLDNRTARIQAIDERIRQRQADRDARRPPMSPVANSSDSA